MAIFQRAAISVKDTGPILHFPRPETSQVLGYFHVEPVPDLTGGCSSFMHDFRRVVHNAQDVNPLLAVENLMCGFSLAPNLTILSPNLSHPWHE